MNSTQQSIRRSRVSLAKARSLGRISDMIFWTVAAGYQFGVANAEVVGAGTTFW